jgi:hypothetical protein
MVFVPGHEPPAGEAALVIDGSEVEAGRLDIGGSDLYGFLLEVHEDKLSLHPALYDGSSGPAPALDLQARCGVLDDRMAAFARQFVTA